MTSFLQVFIFLAVVLQEGHSMRCEKCKEYGSTSCQGSIKRCNKCSDKCIQGFENNTLGDDTRLTAFRACHNPREMPPVVCEISEHTMRTSQFYFGLVAECGQDMDELEVPPRKFTPNGHKCPDCLAQDTVEGCKPDKTIECVGRETECINFRGKAKRPGSDMVSYSAAGCSTPGFCSILHLLPGTKVDTSATHCDLKPAPRA